MTGKRLYKFVNDHELEWHWHENGGEQDVLLFLKFYQLEELNTILSLEVFDDEGIELIMKKSYVCVWMGYICQYYDIDMTAIFSPYKEN